MPRNVTEFRCLLISPGDVVEERNALTELVTNWNAQVGKALGTRLELVRWETHSVPDMPGEEPQAVLNRQIVSDCDFGIALFWSRLGTPTAQHDSGSTEEIQQLQDRGCRVMVYFKKAPIPGGTLESIDPEQLRSVKAAKKRFQQSGILAYFDGIPDLVQQVQLNITAVMVELLQRVQGEPSAVSDTPTVLRRANIKVRCQNAVVAPDYGTTFYVIGVIIENHGTIPFYLRNITIQLKDGRYLYPPRDGVTGAPQTHRILQPGEGFTFHLAQMAMRKSDLTPDNADCVVVTDEIGRRYESDRDEFPKVVAELLASDEDE